MSEVLLCILTCVEFQSFCVKFSCIYQMDIYFLNCPAVKITYYSIFNLISIC